MGGPVRPWLQMLRFFAQRSGFASIALAHDVESEAEVDEVMDHAINVGAGASQTTGENTLGRMQRLFQ
ncbi:MAG: hypothetical protein ACI8PT_000900 [Gammaproteobacteria bacterium]|jgi:hypothetical protein